MKLSHLLLPCAILLLTYGFWLSADFKTLAAGVAILVFGVLSLEQGVHALSGGLLQKILRNSTDTLWKSVGFGVLTTTLMQSSGLISIITISFLSAGLLELTAGIGIVYGANLGTTTGAWLIAGFGLKVNIAAYAMPLLVFGILLVLQKAKALQSLGYILSGLGFLLLGIDYMKSSFAAFEKLLNLQAYAPPGWQGFLLFTGIGMLATMILQSSHASLMIIITALSYRQITYENALALVIGANIGTTISAAIGAIGANVQGKRLAAAQFLFKAITAVIAVLLLQQLMYAVDRLSIYLHIGNDYTLKLAVFHSLFNLLGLVVMLPFTEFWVSLLQRLFPEISAKVDQPRYLNDTAMDFPEAANEVVRQETLHLYLNATHIILRVLGLPKKGVFSAVELSTIVDERRTLAVYAIDEAYERNIKGIYSAIIAFISRCRFSRAQDESGGLYWLREANRNIVEALKSTKHLQKNLCRIFATYSEHPARRQYHAIRLQLAGFLRNLEQLRLEAENGELSLLQLDHLKATTVQEDREMNRILDALIRDRKLTPEIGTSLLNDCAYMYDIKRSLIKMAEAVFIHRHDDTAPAQRQITLNDAELHAAIAAPLQQETGAARPEPAISAMISGLRMAETEAMPPSGNKPPTWYKR